MAQLTSLISMKHTWSRYYPLRLPPSSSQQLYIADLGHPITRSSMIPDLGDVQIDLSRKYRGTSVDGGDMVMGIDGIGTDWIDPFALGAPTS